jgi:hypothetical protein
MVILAAFAAIFAGTVRTVWVLVRGPLARALRKDGL